MLPGSEWRWNAEGIGRQEVEAGEGTVPCVGQHAQPARALVRNDSNQQFISCRSLAEICFGDGERQSIGGKEPELPGIACVGVAGEKGMLIFCKPLGDASFSVPVQCVIVVMFCSSAMCVSGHAVG